MAKNIVIFVILAISQSVTSSTLNVNVAQVDKIFHGRYTRDVSDAELLVPRHVHQDGIFKSFMLPNFYSRDEINERRKRSSSSSSLDENQDKLHLILPFNGKEHHIELSPFHDFISPEMVIEIRGEGTGTNISKGLRFERATDEQCHYRGFVRGHRDSRAALSLCDGVAGYVLIDNARFFIEPLENSLPGNQGQHVHMIYKRHTPHEEKESRGVCDTSDDWESAWEKQLAKRARRIMETGNIDKLKRPERGNVSSSTHSLHRYIEIGLVADKKFLEFWKGADPQRYLLTIMNMVSDFYHDATVGNQIDVVIVRMIFLEAEKEEFDLRISPKSEETLSSFAAWAKRINPADTAHPNHFDVAVLVTRHDICSAKSGCVLMGLAYLAGACDPDEAAALCEDSGLLLGIVIAHEVGHVMGCSHDDEKISGCPAKDRDNSYFIMSPVVFIYTLRWSPCSRRFISNLLNSGLGECLLDEPKNPSEKFKYPNMLPGVMYDSDAQCSLMEPNAFTCTIGGYATCHILWCQRGTTCFTSDAPPAEGTSCGGENWCVKQQCVSMGSRPGAVHGGWGEWGPTSECSRTCGAGISTTERECNNPMPSNGGRYCLGERRRITICNTEECAHSEPSFRAVQCSENDSKKILTDGLHKWAPFLRGDLDVCSLYCINERKAFVKLGQVKDATPCKSGTRNMCIAGTCRQVGCDWELDSNAIEDQCGICRGDGTQCSFVEGQYTGSRVFGYAKIITIPKGATDIRIVENYPSANLLAIKYEKDAAYCINGGLRINYPGEYECAGARLIYRQPQYQQEEVEIKGPITEDIQIQLLFVREKNRGIYYRYSLPKNAPSEYKPKYLWDFTEWSMCDVNCGGGTMVAMPVCIEENHGMVSANYCERIPQPAPQVRICNENPCRRKWRTSEWSQCSSCKGRVGQQTRKVQCVKKASHLNGDDIETDLGECIGPPPIQAKKCIGTKPCQRVCRPKPKNPPKRQDISSRSNKISSKGPDDINNPIDTNMMRYLEKAEDRGVIGKNEDSDGNEKTKEELRKVLHDWALENKEKRMCGDEKYVVEVETKVTSTVPEAFSTDEESQPNSSGAQTQVITTEPGLNLETSYEQLTTSMTKSSQDENVADEDDTEMKPLSTLEPGTIIKDEYPLDKAVLLEAPIRDDSFKANLSDIAFQEIGDVGRVQIDTSRQKVYKGPEARERLNEMAYGNVTDFTESPDDDNTEKNPADS